MKMQKKSAIIGLSLLLFSYLPVNLAAQAIESLVDNPNEQLSSEEIEAILAVNKMKVYKFPVKIPEDQKCIVGFYKQEYSNGDLIEDENFFGSRSPHVKVVDRQVVLTEDGQRVFIPLDGIRIITKEEETNFSLGIKIGEFEIPSMPVNIDSKYPYKHHVRSFEIPREFPIGSEIPLVLIGSSWPASNVDGTSQITKFCWGEAEEIEPDLTSKEFTMMPHFIIFGVRILEYQ